MLNIGLNLFHLLFVGPLVFLLGYANLKGANNKVVKFMRSMPVSVVLMLLGVAVVIAHTVYLVKKTKNGFMIGDERRLLPDQYDNTKLMGTQGLEQEAVEFTTGPGYTFNGSEQHATTHEGFIAENLPLWTEK